MHVHVFPRYAGDGFGFRFGPAYHTRPARQELDEIAGRIREALDAPAQELQTGPGPCPSRSTGVTPGEADVV